MSKGKNSIIIGCDHAGFSLKEKIAKYLTSVGYSVKDAGCFSTESVDYPDYAQKVAKSVTSGKFKNGILVCGTGIGMAISANRFKGIRALPCIDERQAVMSRSHNNANILCLGGRLIRAKTAFRLIDIWLNTPFEGDRHIRRLNKIDEINCDQGND